MSSARCGHEPVRAPGAWDAMAAYRDQRQAWIAEAAAPVTAWLVEALALRPGETVLELAAGAGDVGFAVLERAGHGVRLISSDVSQATLDVARRAAAGRTLRDVEFRLIDAQSIDLPADAVDAVVCRWGYMLMDDPAAALRETARVLRPSGRVALSVWGSPERNPWTTVDADICSRLGYVPPVRPTERGQIFSLGDPDGLRATIERAGLAVRRLEPVALAWSYSSVDDYIGAEIDLPGPRGDFLRSLPEAKRRQAQELARELLEPWQAGDGHHYVVPAEALNVLAVREAD